MLTSGCLSLASIVLWLGLLQCLNFSGALTEELSLQSIDSSVHYSGRTLTSAADIKFLEYQRGKGKYSWVLPPRLRENGMAYTGANERLRVAMSKLKAGKPIKVATIGGSITAGQGAVDAPNWPQYVFNWLTDNYDGKATGWNGAVAGTLSGYMSVCHNMHIPKDVDVVFVEYSVNDNHQAAPLFQNNIRRAFERLLRKLMAYPNAPAVVLVHAYVWYFNHPFEGSYWGNAEREFQEFATYYHLPAVSLKACCYELLRDGTTPGFMVKSPRSTNENGLKGQSFYWDPIHPDGRTGARVLAELAMHVLQRTYDDVTARPVTPEEEAYAREALPPPMIPQNYESKSEKCFIGNQFQQTVGESSGFEWINESKTPRPKWGYVATTVGSKLKLKVDTRAGSTGSTQGAPGATTEVLVELAYLRSYEHMGKARVTCEGGCKCQESVLQGHGTDRNSQLHLHNFYASQAEDCVIAIEVLSETTSGEHKVKIAGIMISEEAGHGEGIRNSAAVEYVHDISARHTGNVSLFEVGNHARRLLL